MNDLFELFSYKDIDSFILTGGDFFRFIDGG